MEKKAPEFPVGTEIGRWRVNGLLGRGGQGSVWAAKPVKTKHTPQRALKVCFASDEQARARFEREVEILKRCDSPHILKVYDDDLDWKVHVPDMPPFAYYVSEKCQGSLEQRPQDLRDFRRCIDLFRQACAAVTHLHTMPDPVIHRDIKPANFLITKELSNIVLADFGIVRSLASSVLTEAFEVVGTPYYRAPEVLHGGRGTILSDVYCMGRFLEWLLTQDVSQDMGTRPVPRGRDLDDEACDILDRIITKATLVIPENRFTSVQEMADQLPELWYSVRPRPKTSLAVASTDPATVLTVALELARKNDQLGWRQQEAYLRRGLMDGLVKWRADNEREWRDGHKEIAFLVTDKIFDVACGRLIFALAGVYSNNPVLADQRRVVDDFLTIPSWNPGGTTAIVEGPRALLYLFHYLHGALCLSYGQIDLAIQLAAVPVPSERGDDTSPLWRHTDLTGWPKLLGGDYDYVWAWEYLCGLRERRTVLQQLFALQTDFDVGLASYAMVLSLLEFAADAARASPLDLTQEHIFLDVPPLFLGMASNTIVTAARCTVGNRALVERIVDLTGSSHSTMKQRWPDWKKCLLKFHRAAFKSWRYRDEHLGDLA
jgi:hypothetical protein